MPPRNKAAEKKILDLIKKVNSYAGTKLSYKDLYKKIDRALKGEDTQREGALVEIYTGLSREIGKKLLPMRTVMQSNFVLGEKYKGHKATEFSITIATRDAKNLVSKFCDMIEPENPEKHEITPNQLDAIRDWELNELKTHSIINEVPKYLSHWNLACYEQDLENLEDLLDGHTFRGDSKVALDITTSEFYLKKLHVSAELASHGRIWRFFNSKKVAMYEKYIQEVDKKLEKVGFKPEDHNDVAFELLRNNIMPPHSMDVDNVKETHSEQLTKYKANHIEHINLARNRIAQAQNLDESPETSFEKKIEPILKKYDLAKINVGKSITALEAAAVAYDKSRGVKDYQSMMRMAFFLSLNDITVQAMKSGKDVDMADIVRDARTVCVTFAAHYTPFLEVEEYAELETPVYLKNVDEKTIANRINFANSSSGAGLEQEQKDKMVRDALNVINEWNSDPQKIKNEDRERAESLNSKQQIGNEESNKEIANGMQLENNEPFRQKLPPLPEFENDKLTQIEQQKQISQKILSSEVKAK